MAYQASRNPPFRAEHIGSLLRPNELLNARNAVEAGEQSAEELKALEDINIRKIVKLQQDLGYSAITDGEYRRHMFWGSFFAGLQGMTEIQSPSADIFREYVPDIAAFMETNHKPPESVICTGKIKHIGSTYVDQFNFLKTLISPDQVKNLKLTMAVPNWYHLRYKEGRAYPKDVYSSDSEYFNDIVKAYQEEFRILYAAGLRNVQFDDPNLAYFCSEKMIAGWERDSLNRTGISDLLDTYIKVYNDCISKSPADMHFGVHLCRGNFVDSRHFSEGGYDRIAAKLFQELNMSTYYLEYDTARAGGFEPLAQLPKHKNVILGVITSKFATLENVNELKKRVVSAAEYMAKGSGQSISEALGRLGVSPQCGFASHSSGNAIDREGMIAKLKLVRKLAESIWPGES
ncbi:hypothetical protein FQN57_001587 [Myotisia sp. PD_48]|nr:hypothetical protein FQN57_001587 [Myotisia sp. PD_48]